MNFQVESTVDKDASLIVADRRNNRANMQLNIYKICNRGYAAGYAQEKNNHSNAEPLKYVYNLHYYLHVKCLKHRHAWRIEDRHNLNYV